MKESDLDRILDESLSQYFEDYESEPIYNSALSDELLTNDDFAFLAVLSMMISQFERKCKNEFTQNVFR